MLHVIGQVAMHIHLVVGVQMVRTSFLLIDKYTQFSHLFQYRYANSKLGTLRISWRW